MKSQETTPATGEYSFEGMDGIDYTVTHYADGVTKESRDFEETFTTETDRITYGLHTSHTIDETGVIIDSSSYDYVKY